MSMALKNFCGFCRLRPWHVVLFFVTAFQAFAMDRVSGANATLDIEPGARSAALGSATMAVDGDYLGLVSNPYQLSGIRYGWANFSHTAYFEDTQYDFASAAVSLGEGQGLGVSFARFGADDIPYIREGEPVPEGSDYNTLSYADWMFSVTFGRRIMDRLDIGVGFHGLYREMDQTGWGFRGDAGIRYRLVDKLFVSGLLKGWTSSAVTWESGEVEYSSPELYLAASYSLPVSYLYGTLGLYWQSAGWLHHEARALDFDTDEDSGGRLWDDPVDWLSGGRGGVEFIFDFGLSLRAGLSSFSTLKSVTAGAGLVIAKFLRVDYAFESHPVLSPVHRVSISISPYLFSHPEKAAPVESRVYLVEEAVVQEVSSEDNEKHSSESGKPAQPVEEADESTETPEESTETQDEVLYNAPAGGVYWEE